MRGLENGVDEAQQLSQIIEEAQQIEEDLGDVGSREYGRAIEAQAFRIQPIRGDSNSVFRAIAHQICGDDERLAQEGGKPAYAVVRAAAVDYMVAHQARFAPLVSATYHVSRAPAAQTFGQYIAKMRTDGTPGGDVEIQAMCERYDRPGEVHVPCSDQEDGGSKVLRNFNGIRRARGNVPIRLSFIRGHYSSVVGNDTVEHHLGAP